MWPVGVEVLSSLGNSKGGSITWHVGYDTGGGQIAFDNK